MTDATLEYDSQGHPYTPLDQATSLRYARAAEDRYAGTDLPPPDLDEGTCSECHRDTHTRWTHGQQQLCRNCRRRRERITHLKPKPQPQISSIRIPRFAGECQRCTTTGLLALVAHLFLCPHHAKRAARAQRAPRERARRLKGTET